MHEKVCDHDYFNMIMPGDYHEILKHTQDKKSRKTPFVIHANTNLLLEKIHACDNNPEESFATKISKYTACG